MGQFPPEETGVTTGLGLLVTPFTGAPTWYTRCTRFASNQMGQFLGREPGTPVVPGLLATKWDSLHLKRLGNHRIRALSDSIHWGTNLVHPLYQVCYQRNGTVFGTRTWYTHCTRLASNQMGWFHMKRLGNHRIRALSDSIHWGTNLVHPLYQVC
jgi:hypothetical protein